MIERSGLSRWEVKARRWRRLRPALGAIAGWLDASLMAILWSVFLGILIGWALSIWSALAS